MMFRSPAKFRITVVSRIPCAFSGAPSARSFTGADDGSHEGLSRLVAFTFLAQSHVRGRRSPLSLQSSAQLPKRFPQLTHLSGDGGAP